MVGFIRILNCIGFQEKVNGGIIVIKVKILFSDLVDYALFELKTIRSGFCNLIGFFEVQHGPVVILSAGPEQLC